MQHPRDWAERLESLGQAVRRQVLAEMSCGVHDWATPVGHEGGDTIFAIDRRVESVVEREIDAWPAECKPLVLIAEGFGAEGRRSFGNPEASRFRLLIDPIDGTRGLMYDKRSAWFLAAVAPDQGDATRLVDVVAAVLVELPTSKQAWCDSYLATAEERTWARRRSIDGQAVRDLVVRPSTATDLSFGFAQVANFFPGTKVLAAELMERIASETTTSNVAGQSLIFDDQYISTGGQMAELIAGHDRFTCDLRPLFHDLLRRRGATVTNGLECHPYDIAAALVARQAGVILTDGHGAPLDAPFDVTTGVHWCGYANEAIRRKIEPIIGRWLKEQHDTPWRRSRQ